MKELMDKLLLKLKDPKFIGPLVAMLLAGVVTIFADFKPILREICTNVLESPTEESPPPIELPEQ